MLPAWRRLPLCNTLSVASQNLQAAAASVRHVFSSTTVTPPTWLPAAALGWILRRRRGPDIAPTTPLTAGALSAVRAVPPHIVRPAYAVNAPAPGGSSSSSTSSKGPGLSKQPEIQADDASRAAMRAAGQLAARALQLAGSMALPGVTTDDIDAAVHAFLIEHSAYPSPLGYHGFPKTVCTSVNEVVCHGIPDSRPLREGDIVNVDVTCYLHGFHGDTNATFLVGHTSDAARELVDVTARSLAAAIDVCGPGVPFRAIGHTIQAIADAAGMTIIRGFVGHGIGRVFHAAPAVLHHRNMRLDVMQRWQTFTIEPILALGTRQDAGWPADPTGWTRVTADCSLAAQFEHTLMVTDTGVDVLTQLPSRADG